jgi:hypothetical protein
VSSLAASFRRVAEVEDSARGIGFVADPRLAKVNHFQYFTGSVAATGLSRPTPNPRKCIIGVLNSRSSDMQVASDEPGKLRKGKSALATATGRIFFT